MKNIILQMKWTLRSVLLVLLLSISVLSTWANPVDIRQAQEVAAKFAKNNLNKRMTSIDRILLAKVYPMSDGRSGCYVFNLNPGFVIVAADDCAVPILGYSEDSQLDSDHIPIQMDVYIRGFVKQLQYGIERGIGAEPDVAAQWASIRQTGCINGQKADRSLGPLLSTQWDQGCYYNNKCPADNNGDCRHVAVGCVATAMGQVLRYWGYPSTGQGTHSYTPDGYATQTVNYGATTYNWSNMPNRLASSSSSTQINAVSTLLWHCGVGVEMQYGAEISWAYFDDVITALQNHFRFPLGMFADWRTDEDTWLALLKGCLNHNCPVYYTAQDDNGLGGHAFVCDGYDSNNYFHFNWGWSGEGDGYFALSALNLFGMEFNTDHYAIFNMAPDPIVLQQNVLASPSNGGSVSGSGSYYFGNTCTLNATANTGYSFVCWKKNGVQVSTNPTYRFRVVESDSYVAVFSPNSCTISASANPSAGGTVSGSGTYNYGSTCTLTATPATGYSFVRWTKNGSQVSTNASYSFTVTESASYVAVFSLNSYNISASANPSAGGTVSGGGSYNYGSNCTLTATPATGYSFVRWTKNGSQVSTNASYSFTVTENATYVAVFSLNSYNISASANPSLGGTVSGSGTYNYGSTCTLTATANTGYTFNNWTENGTVISVAANYSFEATGSRTLVANFVDASGTGKLSGVFSVGEHTQISFSQGNLQYQASSNTWRFAENQWDCVGADNSNISETYSGWIDLFGWGTSGYNHGANSYQPWSTSRNSSDYNVYGSGVYNLYDQTGQADWGCNSIFNGGNGANIWRTMNYEEWRYLLWNRSTTSGIRYAVAQVNGVNGLILLPDDWSSDYYTLNITNNYDSNVISSHDWIEYLEAFGAVFLPAAGNREGNTIANGCSYWFADCYTSNGASYLNVDSGYDHGVALLSNLYCRCRGYSVRLICHDQNNSYNVNVTPEPIGGGYIDGMGDYREGGHCMLVATANEGYTFMSWTENGSVVSTDAIYGFTVMKDRELVANFTLPLTITTSANPPEGGTVSDGGVYDYGATCTVNATADEGYTFMYWTVNGNPVSSEANYSFVVTENQNIVANFTMPLTITTSANPPEGGTVSDGGVYDYGATCTVSATANEGYTFMCWTENGNQVSSNASYTFTVTSDRNLVAHFSQPLTITTSVNPTVGGTVSDGGVYDYGTTCTITATANEGYTFIKWTKNGNTVSYVSPYSFTVTEEAEFVACFEETPGIVVGLPESTNQYLPSYSYYNYTLSQQIYTPEEIGGNTIITNLSFFNTGGQKTRSYDIYMVNTDKNTFNSNTDWIAVMETDRVFSGDVTMLAGQWSTIVLDTPFAFNGTSNLAIVVDDNSGNYTYQPYMTCRVFNADGNQSIRVYSDNTNYDPMSPPSSYASGNYAAVLPVKNQLLINTSVYNVSAATNISNAGSVSGTGCFGFGQTCILTAIANEGYYFYYWTENGNVVSTDANYTFTVTSNRNLVGVFGLPLTITASVNHSEGGVAFGTGEYNYNTTCILTATANEGYSFIKWTKNGETVSYLSPYSFTVTEDAEYVAHFEEISGVVVGTPESTNEYLPSFSYYKYTLSQQIYTPDEIGATGFISTLSYFNAGATKTRNYDIYMVHTDKTVFESSTDWITVTEADHVFSGDVTMESGYWTTIVLDMPFAYDGISNLAIIVDDNSGNWTYSPHMACRTFHTNGKQAIRTFSDNTNFDPYNPSGYYGTLHSEKNQVIFRILPIYHFVTSGTWGNAANWSGGIMPGTNDAVSIDANCALNRDAEVAVLAITPDKTLTIRSGKTLTVTSTLANKATTGLVIKEGAQLINASGKVAAMMEKGISAHDGGSFGWYTIASPMNEMPIAGSDFVTPEYDLYRFNETNLTNEEWENHKANLADFTSFEKGRGYLYANSNNFTSTFTGILNASSVTYHLTCTNRPNDPLSGFHLIGNPFPHEIYKGAGGAIDNANLASGYYTLDDDGTWQVHSFDDAILPGQGILVKATAPTTLTIAKSTEEALAESGEAKRGMSRLCISVTGDSGHDRAYVYFGQGIGLEKVKDFTQTVPSLAIRTEKGDFAIAHYDKESDVIELVFTTPDSGSVTLNVKANANDFEHLHMVDMFTGADIDLLQQSSYTFDASGQAGERHFMLHYKQLEK